MKNPRGFTLIELIVTIAILAILLGLAAPSFRDLIENNRTATRTNDLVAALNFARSEAIKRGVDVSLCRTGADFANGFSIRTGTNCGGGVLLRQHDALQGVTITVAPANLDRITYNGRGAATSNPAANPATFTLRPPTCPAGAVDRARELSINNVGRTSLARINC